MKVEIKIAAEYSEPRVIVLTDKMTEEIQSLIDRISEKPHELIAGFSGDTMSVIDPESVIRVYASSGKVIAETDRGQFRLRLRLYELENSLDRRSFVRISNSEIVNLKKVRNFDLSFTGTICVSLSNGTNTYVSRRYVQKIKQVLGI